MSTQKAKFELFARLGQMGFTYDEAAQLRRIEMTLTRWRERECGDGSDWAIERDETTGKPFNVYHGEGRPRRYAIADREAGALKRAKAIVDARNARNEGSEFMAANAQDHVFLYDQQDCRGAAIYLVKRSDIPPGSTVEGSYPHGLAVCA